MPLKVFNNSFCNGYNFLCWWNTVMGLINCGGWGFTPLTLISYHHCFTRTSFLRIIPSFWQQTIFPYTYSVTYLCLPLLTKASRGPLAYGGNCKPNAVIPREFPSVWEGSFSHLWPVFAGRSSWGVFGTQTSFSCQNNLQKVTLKYFWAKYVSVYSKTNERA